MEKICSAEGCDRPRKKGRYCRGHAERVKKHGDPRVHIPLRAWTKSPAESFAARTRWNGDCLEWTGAMHETGYGIIWNGKRTQNAHRWAYEQKFGEVPSEVHIDHICFNRKCVNVEHLRAASSAENGSNLSYISSKSKTRYRNVYPHGKGYEVSIQKNGRATYFGTYETLEEAVKVAAKKREELFGKFAGRGEVA
ncbi:HNH endonuclease [Brevibacterium casei]|uniref:HNH endonuclease signature motif containing protein n=1 Tax=Brevibacterium casei TaxID=33889 RepID=UPI00223A7FFD|nr:HNH endonuclease signature motif containing protein [Brevibacterium casei]MCT2182856.1 HNH endonuclease [Brevibacterium casei]